jgi:hypothetical protein
MLGTKYQTELETQIAAQKKLATTVVFSGPCEER